MRRGLKGYWLGFNAILFFLFALPGAYAQDIKVSGGFVKDSIQIGESVGYYLTVKYPQSLTVLFPDSTYSFAPFEFNKKTFSTTSTSNGVSRDSVVYYLSTFEVDKIQTLNLPVFVTSARDCTTYNPSTDTIFLIEAITSPPDSVAAQNLPLKTNTLYERVFTQFNYIIILIASAVLLLAAVISWVFFGKRIITYFKLRKLKKSHLKFLQAFSDQFQQLNALFTREKAETAISLWKKYLEQLEQKPYTKLTTRETIEMEPNEKLRISLQMVDRAIYGNQTAVYEPLDELKQYAEERFHKKFEEVKNG